MWIGSTQKACHLSHLILLVAVSTSVTARKIKFETCTGADGNFNAVVLSAANWAGAPKRGSVNAVCNLAK
jgi:hypothetical protein